MADGVKWGVKQSRQWSALEAATNVVTGYGIGVLVNLAVLPWLGYPVQVHHAAAAGLPFALASLARGYVVRRAFASLTGAPGRSRMGV